MDEASAFRQIAVSSHRWRVAVVGTLSSEVGYCLASQRRYSILTGALWRSLHSWRRGTSVLLRWATTTTGLV